MTKTTSTKAAAIKQAKASEQTSGTIVSQLITKLSEEQFELPTETNDLWNLVENSEVYACLYHIKAGLAYKALKEQLAHGEFEKELKLRGIPSRTVRDRVSVADLFFQSSEPNRRALADLTFTNMIELTRLPDEKIQQLTCDEIEEFKQLPSRALKATVKQMNLEFDQEQKLEAQNASLKKHVESLQEQHADAINELGNERMTKAPEAMYGLPPLVATIRQQAPAVSQQLHEHGLDVVNLVERLIMPGLDHEQAKMAAQALYHFVAGPYKQIGLAMNRLIEHFGDDLIGDDAMLPTYSDAEWEAAENKRQTVILFHQDGIKKRNKRGRK